MADWRMVLMTSSRLSRAIFRPSRMWARSLAMRSSYLERRVMTSRRKSMKYCSASLRRDDARLPVHQRQHVDEEGGLHGGVFVEVVEHLARLRFALQLDDDAHALAVGLVAQVADAVDLLVLDQLGDALDQGGLVDLVGQLGDDDLLALRAGGVLDE